MPMVLSAKSTTEDASVPAVAVEDQLRRLLQSPLFSHSRRYPGFLRYVVEATLNGRQDQLKERSIGIEVFQRRPDYDLNLDPVVRVTAGEVRKRLAQYYYEAEHQDEIRIELRPGSYVPEFRQPPDVPTRHDPPAAGAEAAGFIAVVHAEGAAEEQSASADDASAAVAAGIARRPARLRWQWLALAVGLAAAGIVYPFTDRKSALEEFWRPALAGPSPVIISVGSWESQLPSPNTVSIGAHAEAVSPVALSDTITIAHLQQFLAAHGHTTQIEVSSQTTFSDLQHGTAVLVSAFDNQWTMRLTAPLRFHFANHDNKVLAI